MYNQLAPIVQCRGVRLRAGQYSLEVYCPNSHGGVAFGGSLDSPLLFWGLLPRNVRGIILVTEVYLVVCAADVAFVVPWFESGHVFGPHGLRKLGDTHRGDVVSLSP